MEGVNKSPEESWNQQVKEVTEVPDESETTDKDHDEDKDKDKDKDKDDAKESKTQASELIQLCSAAELFKTRDEREFATLDVNGHKETWALKSDGFRKLLRYQFYKQNQRTPSQQALTDAIDTLCSKAKYEGASHEVHTRFAMDGADLIIDLANENWEIVRVPPAGKWRVEAGGKVKFRRSKTMLPLPKPEEGGGLRLLDEFINAVDDDKVLAKVFILDGMIPKSSHVVAAIQGEQGSAKSSLSELIKMTVDPSKPSLRSLPKSEQDLAIAAQTNHFLAFDNLSGLSTQMSDALCRLSTGGGIGTRELYSNDEESVFDFKRPLILNGIDDIATRDDLRNRAIVLNLPTIDKSQRQAKTAFWNKFSEKHALILGALCDALSKILAEIPKVNLSELPRMADFAITGVAAERALKWEVGSFMKAYDGNQNEAIEAGLDSDPLASAIREYLASNSTLSGKAPEVINMLASKVHDRVTRSPGWPTPKTLKNKLTRLKPALRTVHIEYEYIKTADERKHTLKKCLPQRSSSSSSSSQLLGDKALQDDRSSQKVVIQTGQDRHSEQTDFSVTILNPSLSQDRHPETVGAQANDSCDANDSSCGEGREKVKL